MARYATLEKEISYQNITSIKHSNSVLIACVFNNPPFLKIQSYNTYRLCLDLLKYYYT